jgi:hypothetical protein
MCLPHYTILYDPPFNDLNDQGIIDLINENALVA